ncbi:MAG: phosphoenolpyruvate--protein phosphotransferase, partial [Nitrospiria bacterium]
MKKRTRHFKGIAVSPGIAIGRVHLIESEALSFPKFWISDREINPEISRFQRALKKTQQEFLLIKEKLCKFQAGDQVRIIESHQMFLHDEMLIQGTLQTIRQEKINAEWAFDKAIHKLRATFPEEGNDYFRERYNEIAHVVHRVLQNLLGTPGTALRQFKQDSIVVTHDLSPTETAQMVKGMVHGFLTETGGPTSHTAIVARALEIPAVVGIEGISHLVRDGDLLLIDGIEGVVILHPTKSNLAKYTAIQKKYEHFEEILLKETHLASVTQDGYHLRLAANMELLEEIPAIKSHGAEGIGLYRTEMLYLSRKSHPTEKEQFEIYRDLLQKISPASATIRTLDIGGDKIVSESDFIENVNPALGLRAIRFCLKERNLLTTQIRAMLRASRYGSLNILIPMVTSLEEIRQVKKIIAE